MNQIAKTIVTIYRFPWNCTSGTENYFKDRENWFSPRQETFSYKSSLEGEMAAEEAFVISNAPEECLSDREKSLLEKLEFKGPSLSVGDVVRVAPLVSGSKMPEYYLCKSVGWEKFSGNVIELLKNYSY